MPKKFECIVVPPKGKNYEICIWDSLEHYEEYDGLIEKINKIQIDDTVTIKVSTSGGRCDIGFMLIDRFKSLPCPVNIIVPYPTYSMGAIMALCGHSLNINEGSFLMFHDYSTGGHSKGNELIKSAEAYGEIFAHRFNKICQPFLTKKECKEVLEGRDLYIKWNDPTLKDRVKRHFK